MEYEEVIATLWGRGAMGKERQGRQERASREALQSRRGNAIPYCTSEKRLKILKYKSN